MGASMMHDEDKRIPLGTIAIATVVFVAFAGPATGQIADHLRCYKIKDPETRATYTANLDGLTPGVGCIIRVPAKLACVPSTKTNVAPRHPKRAAREYP